MRGLEGVSLFGVTCLWLVVVASVLCPGCGSGSTGSGRDAGDDFGMRDAAADAASSDTGAETQASRDGGSDVGAAVPSDGGPDGASAEGGGDTVWDGGSAGPGCSATQGSQTCGAPTQCGPVIHMMGVVGTAPTAAGGTVVPGLYFATQFNVYQAHSGGVQLGTFQETMDLAAGSFSSITYLDGWPETPVSGTYAASSTMFSRTRTCPSGPVASSVLYSATPTTLTLYEMDAQDGTATDEIIFTKQ